MRVVCFRLGAAGGWRRITLAVALALLATLARPSAVEAQGGAPASADEIPLRPRTVVVVPFVNISGDPDIDWLGTGIAPDGDGRFGTTPRPLRHRPGRVGS